MLIHKNKYNHNYYSKVTTILNMVKFISSISQLKHQWKFLITEINKTLATEHTIFYSLKKKTNVIMAWYCLNNKLEQIQKPAIWGFAEYAIRSGKIIRVDKNHKYPYLQMEISHINQTPIETFLIVPIVVESDVLGCIQVTNKKSGCFKDDDIKYLMMIATMVPNIFKKNFHHSGELHYDDIKRAEKNQRQLLPAKTPDIPGYKIFAYNEPSEFVGGDYFDFFQFPGKLSFIVSDVSGKGVSAALLMANMQAFLHAFVNENETARKIVNKVNSHFYNYSTAEMFATFFCGNLNHNAHSLNYVNAGHIPPLLIRNGSIVKSLESGGIPIGMLDSHDYKESEIFFDPGDILIVVSDGILEAMNEKRELFGMNRLEKICLQNSHLDIDNVGGMIVNHVKKFCGNNKKTDDQTIMIIKRDGINEHLIKPNIENIISLDYYSVSE